MGSQGVARKRVRESRNTGQKELLVLTWTTGVKPEDSSPEVSEELEEPGWPLPEQSEFQVKGSVPDGAVENLQRFLDDFLPDER